MTAGQSDYNYDDERRTVHPPPGAWRLHAACRGMHPDLFYPERGEPTGEAKRVCGACPVREDCLNYSVETAETYGIWGGQARNDRRRARARRAVS